MLITGLCLYPGMFCVDYAGSGPRLVCLYRVGYAYNGVLVVVLETSAGGVRGSGSVKSGGLSTVDTGG